MKKLSNTPILTNLIERLGKFMKTKNMILSLVLFTTSQQTLANAFTEGLSAGTLPARPVTENPFVEGTGIQRLSIETKNFLLQWAKNSKSSLEKALQKARGEGFIEANRIYRDAIIDVVVRSYQTEKAGETLMRHVLNQALELTIGLPDQNGKVYGGILSGSVNQELLTVILEQSIKLAIDLYPGDERCINQGIVRTEKDVMSTAISRLKMARKWTSGIFEPSVQLVFQRQVLSHFVATSTVKTNVLVNSFAEMIVQANDAIDIGKDYNPQDVNASIDVPAAVRELRGEINDVVQDAEKRMSEIGYYSKR